MFNISKQTNASDILSDINAVLPPTSEEMLRRDNFFHTCWMLMKRDHPELSDQMSIIELETAGYTPKTETDEKEDEPEEEGKVL